MPFLDEPYKPFATAQRLANEEIKQEAPGFSATVGAAFRLENDVVAMYNLNNRPVFERDPNFNLAEVTKKSKYWDTQREAFLEAQSQEEWDWLAAKLEKENADRETLSAAGLPGMGAAMLAGILSPTMLIPLATPYKGLKALASATALAGVASAAQEIPLQLDQLTRTPEESALAIATGTILGGVLGGAAAHFSNAERKLAQYNVARQAGDLSPRQIEPIARTAVQEAAAASPELARVGTMSARVIDAIETDKIVSEAQLRIIEADSAVVRKFVTENFGDFVDVVAVPSRSNKITKWSTEFTGEPGEQIVRLPTSEVIHVTNDGDFVSVNSAASPYHIKDGKLADEAVALQARQVPSVTGDLRATNTIDTADAGAALNPSLPKRQVLKAKTELGRKALNKIGSISPVVRTISQTEFPVLGRIMQAISNAGLKLSGAAKGEVNAIGGTIENRAKLYDVFVAKTVRVTDEYYASYVFNGQTPTKFPVQRAALKSTFRDLGGKLDKAAFKKEISRAMIEGDHTIPEVKAAAELLRTEVTDVLENSLREVGIIKGDIDLGEDKFWLSRMYDTVKIDADPTGLVDTFAEYYKQTVAQRIDSMLTGVRTAEEVFAEFEDDMMASAFEAAKRRELFAERLKGLEETDQETQIKALYEERKGIRAALKTGVSFQQKDLHRARLGEIKNEIAKLKVEKADNGRVVSDIRAERADLRRRLRNLDRTYWALSDKKQKLLQRIDRVEETSLRSLNALITKGQSLQKNLMKLDEATLRKQLEIFSERYHRYTATWAKREDRLTKLAEDAKLKAAGDEPDLEDYYTYWNKVGNTHSLNIDRMESAFEKLQNAEDIFDNRAVLADLLESITREAAEHTNRITLNRGRRIEKLTQRADKIDPEEAFRRIELERTKLGDRKATLNDRLREMGVEDFDIATGKFNIDGFARERAEATVAKIQGLNNRLSGLHVIGEERGSELERILKISSMAVTPNGQTLFDRYLVTDIEQVMRNYIRQVGADIELARTFGTVDGKLMMKAAEEEYFTVLRAMEEAGATQQEMDKATRIFRRGAEDIAASIMRLRHTWGIPQNPNGFAARAAGMMLDVNTLRFMGSVAVSSIPDPGRPVMKYGLTKTLKKGYLPLITNFKAFKAAARELKLAGGALDTIIHSRALAISDMMEDLGKQSKLERGIHILASKIGVIAAFDYWTSGMKQLSAVIQVSELMDSIEMVVNGSAKGKELNKATEYLASVGIDSHSAYQMWEAVQNGAGGKVNGVWLPNTEDWPSDLQRLFRQALRGESDNTIITPGLELPLIANSGLGTRLLFQFKSFALSSHMKSMMAGMQEQDLRVVSGIATSVALGMLSYAISAKLIGGETEKKMMNADFDHWLDEGIARAGLHGAFSEVQRIAERIPATANYANFAGQQTTRRAGSGLMEALFGPTFDAAGEMVNIATGIDDPTDATVGSFFNLLPLQNVFYLRAAFRALEDAIKENFPDRRN